MKETKDCCFCIVDHGLFVPVAQRIAKDAKRVLYHKPDAMEGFPTINKCIIGDGYADIECVEDIWEIKKDVDVWVFPDIQHSGLQVELESQGFDVWGARNGDSLEINREKFHKVLKSIGLDVPKFTTIQGMSRLKQHLKGETDKFIKISRYRGSLETFHWRDWDSDEGILDMLSVRFGPAKELIPFMVFDAIDTTLEIGGDTYCVDGKWPSLMLHGDEFKDKAYIGTVTERDNMPDQIKDVLTAFSPVLEGFRYRNQWSMELRENFFIDPTCRGGLPSTGSQMEVWDNYTDIIRYGAAGELLEPEPSSEFVAECILKCKTDKGCWNKTRVPDELKDAMKLSCCCEIDGTICFPPDDSHGDDVGWMVAKGSTLRKTIEQMMEYEKLLPDGISIQIESLGNILKDIVAGEEQGIEFTDQEIPEASIVMEEI